MALYVIGTFVLYKVLEKTTDWDCFICVSGCF